MGEEEETKAALAAVALSWGGKSRWVGDYFLGRHTGHIRCRDSPPLCFPHDYYPTADNLGSCPSCALLWFRRMAHE